MHFNVELEYATLFGLRNVDEGYAHRDAGYPPLVLDPIDFNGLYLQQLAQVQATAEAQPAGEA